MSPVESDEEDLTRKQRREQARADRKALEEAEAAGSARRKRLTQIGVVAGVVVVAIVAILIATGGGSSAKLAHSNKERSNVVSKVEGEIGKIPQNGASIGSPTAPVTLQYYGDLECPICKDFSLGALPGVMKKWVSTGKLRIEYRSLETATHEPETFKSQQVAALAAGKQNKMWQYIELFYNQQGEENSGYVTEKYLQGLAQQIPGLNLAQWTTDRGGAALVNQVASDQQTANNSGFTGTPSFLIGKTGGTMTKFEPTSLTDPTAFDEQIEKLQKG